MTNVSLTLKSTNKKTGAIPVSTTSSETCPPTCPLRGNGCYAESYPLKGRWQEVTDGKRGVDWSDFCQQVSALPDGQLWRHNQAGDLPGEGATIDKGEMLELVGANQGKRGFTYTHKAMDSELNRDLVKFANQKGFTVNLSANNLSQADDLSELGIAPIVAVLPTAIQGNVTVRTPAGRRVVVCPATYRDDVTCKSCGLCQRADRKVIVGFPAHGTAAKRANVIAKGELQ